MGYATDYPNRVVLFPAPPRGNHSASKNEFSDSGLCGTVVRETHASWTRSIRKACEFYVTSTEYHQRSLRVDSCAGATYGECFVRLGTGDRKIVGRRWILYDQIWLKDWIDLDAEPLALPLMSTVSDVHRTLAICTTGWPENYRRNLRGRLRAALWEGKAAYRQGEKDRRPWIFFVGCEDLYDQTRFQADLQPGVEVLVCTMPKQRRPFRPSARFVRAARYSYSQAAATEPLSAKAEFVDAPLEDDSVALTTPTTVNNSGQEIGTGSPIHNREDCESADEQAEAKLCPSTELMKGEVEEQLLELSASEVGIDTGSTHAGDECEEAKKPERVRVKPTGDEPTDPDHSAQNSEFSVIAMPQKEVATMWDRMRKTMLSLVRWEK